MAKVVTRFYPRFYSSRVGKIALLTMDNGADYKKPTTFGQQALESLNEALDVIVKEPEVKGLLLTGKPYIFAAGADLTEIPFINTFEQGRDIGRFGHASFKRLMDLPYPTVAAINGAALGGGLEISLYCDYRTVAKTAFPIGFPECFLGLVPGWGGCTLTPRLIGLEKALEIIIYNPLKQNRFISGPAAFEMGLADRLFDSAEFLDESLLFLEGIISGREKVERAQVSSANLKALLTEAKKFVDSKVHGAAVAPYRALELLEGAFSWDVEQGFAEEDKALGDLIKSRQCKASIYSFDLVQRRAKRPEGVPEVPPQKITKVGIVGAGLMASQLALLFIQRYGVPVVMKDIKQEFVDKGLKYVHDELGKLVEKGKLTQAKARYLGSLVQGTLEWDSFADCDFVIEAVFEDMQVKKQVFAEAEKVVSESCILASNTSSLSVSEMASDLKYGDRVVGFHFFNPVAILPLVEIIRGQHTSDAAVATSFAAARKLKKNGILVKDSPAFLVNRLLTKMMVDCLELVDEGAGFEQVDEAMLSLGLPMAPFELLGLVGPAVALHVLGTLNQAFGPQRFPMNTNLQRLVEANKKGIYQGEPPNRRVDATVEALWQKKGDKEFRREEIIERVLVNLTREIDLILQEGVVTDSRDVDLAMLLGAGWPFFMGGITMYLDMAGYTPKVLQKVFFTF
ncbi:MAG: enoyl-CoA hydratase/isomerase family protein [Deltaproteobacteria bacterium]|nr:enoyl-CoA hydratase/isomerase family protein [Deltaproteobacteria bacterium]MBW2070285.1 enoyl-CoA hydratase/isomerase family protein [Deltaproteobacteria bacterium]